MDVSQLEPRLRARHETLWKDVYRVLEKYGNEQYEDLVENAADVENLAAADRLADLDIAEIDRNIREMRAVAYAVDRIKGGVYGICAQCRGPIAEERLEALPHAALCIDCQTQRERS